jgi:MFS family permease
MTSFAVAGIIGGPLAGLIMSSMSDVGHLTSWQWLFVVEGIPSVLAGFALLGYLPEQPINASWLTERQRQLIIADVAADATAPGKHASLRDSFNAKVWLCAAIYFCIVSGNATIAFWSPSIIKELGVQSTLMIGLVSAIPFVLGTIAMVLAGSNSDRTGERRMHCALASALASAGLGMTGFLLHSPVLALVALSVAAIGILAAFPVFWAIPAAIQLIAAVLLIAFVRMKTDKPVPAR